KRRRWSCGHRVRHSAHTRRSEPLQCPFSSDILAEDEQGAVARGAEGTTSFLLVLAGTPVVTLSSAGRARISLKHGLGCTKSQRSHLAVAGSILPYFHAHL